MLLMRLCLFGFSMALAFSSCEESGNVSGSGKVVEEGKNIGEFNRIEFRGMGLLILSQKEDHSSLEISADDNILPYINVRVRGKTLTISTPEEDEVSLKPSRPIEFLVSVPELTKISLAGVGRIRSQNQLSGNYLILNSNGHGNMDLDLNVKDLEVNMTSNSTLDLRGIAERQKIQLSEKARYNGINLDSQKAEVRITGNGLALLHVKESLEAVISGDGIIEYQGTPQVSSQIAGNGKIIKTDK